MLHAARRVSKCVHSSARRFSASPRACGEKPRPPSPQARLLKDADSSELSGKLLDRLFGSSTTSSATKGEKTAHLNAFTTGWGEDKLAPTSGPEFEHSEQSSLDLSYSKSLDDQAFVHSPPQEPFYDHKVQRLHRTERHLQKKPVLEPVQLPDKSQIAKLAHGLEKVCFNRGTYWVKDPRTDVYNFPQNLEAIPRISDFDFDRLPPYIPSSKDNAMVEHAKRHGRRFVGSTSSLTPLLCSLYIMMSQGRLFDVTNLSSEFGEEPRNFAGGLRLPFITRFVLKDGVYAIDPVEEKDKFKSNTTLMDLGILLEQFLTLDETSFSHLLKNNPPPLVPPAPQQYRYSKSDLFIMRAQLDAIDERLPGTGVFDLKTRASVAIRKDPYNNESVGYTIKRYHGLYESFEREYFDLCRSAFLKYLFQVRIGEMDGIFLAYHNTEQLFGFQYVTREEMETRLFGGPTQGEKIFEQCVQCLETVSQEIVSCFPGRDIRCTFNTPGSSLSAFLEPEQWDETTEGPKPIVKIIISSTNYINSHRVHGPLDLGQPDDQWSVQLNITKSSAKTPELQGALRAEYAKLKTRLDAFKFCLPPGVTPTQMAMRYLPLDVTGKTTVPSDAIVDTASESDSNATAKADAAAAAAEELALLSLRFQGARRPSPTIRKLRALSKKGHNRKSKVPDTLTQSLVYTPESEEDSYAAEVVENARQTVDREFGGCSSTAPAEEEQEGDLTVLGNLDSDELIPDSSEEDSTSTSESSSEDEDEDESSGSESDSDSDSGSGLGLGLDASGSVDEPETRLR